MLIVDCAPVPSHPSGDAVASAAGPGRRSAGPSTDPRRRRCSSRWRCASRQQDAPVAVDQRVVEQVRSPSRSRRASRGHRAVVQRNRDGGHGRRSVEERAALRKSVTVPWLRATPQVGGRARVQLRQDRTQRLLGIDARRRKGSGRHRCEVIDQLHHAAGSIDRGLGIGAVDLETVDGLLEAQMSRAGAPCASRWCATRPPRRRRGRATAGSRRGSASDRRRAPPPAADRRRRRRRRHDVDRRQRFGPAPMRRRQARKRVTGPRCERRGPGKLCME